LILDMIKVFSDRNGTLKELGKTRTPNIKIYVVQATVISY